MIDMEVVVGAVLFFNIDKSLSVVLDSNVLTQVLILYKIWNCWRYSIGSSFQATTVRYSYKKRLWEWYCSLVSILWNNELVADKDYLLPNMKLLSEGSRVFYLVSIYHVKLVVWYNSLSYGKCLVSIVLIILFMVPWLCNACWNHKWTRCDTSI